MYIQRCKCNIIHFVFYYKMTTIVGFEPTRPKDNALAGHRVNHSAKLPKIVKTGNRTLVFSATTRRTHHYTIFTLSQTGIEPVTLRSSVLRSPN